MIAYINHIWYNQTMEAEDKKSLKESIVGYFAVLVITSIICLFKIDFSFSSDIFYYALAVFVLFSIVGVFAIVGLKKQGKGFKQILITIIVLLLLFAFTLLMANFESTDYKHFLQIWCDTYSQGSLKDALNSITTVSNYTPAYNYFLILIARLGFNYLYGIKFISLLFTISLAFALTKLICYIRKQPFNYLMFVGFLFIPQLATEFAIWGQCNAIYTSFVIWAFYSALRKRSKLAFMFVGLAFVFKLQFLFILPIMFVLLIVKDKENQHYLKWKHIWIAPAMYLINMLPAIAGTSVLDLLLVYISQSGYDNRISGACANFCYIYFLLGIREGQTIYSLLTLAHFAITIVVLILLLVLIFKTNKKRALNFTDFLFFGLVTSFAMVFFMPKMLDKFYIISTMLSIALMFVKSEKKYIHLAFCLNLAMYSSMLQHLVWFVIGPAIGLIINFITLSIIIKILVKDYIKPLKQAKDNQQNSINGEENSTNTGDETKTGETYSEQ